MFKIENYEISESNDPNLGQYIITDSPPLDFDLNLNSIIMDGHLLSPDQQEETMDVATKQELQEFHPVSPRGPPERTSFAGELNFQVEINATDTHKRKYLYSNKLNRIYVDMLCNFPVQFRWEGARALAPLLVRATVVFSDVSQAQKRVERCTQHTHEPRHADLSLSIVKNVLHSARELGTRGVYYCGAPELPDSWYSVLVEMCPQSTHAFQFVCKNSCPNGINRRSIDIIFSLEDSLGHVYGRQTVGARVCACPRRDMVRDEEEGLKSGKRRLQAQPEPARAKKIRLDVVPASDDGFNSLSIQSIETRALLTGLVVMLSMMEQSAEQKRNDPTAADKYNKGITALRTHIDDLRNTRPPRE